MSKAGNKTGRWFYSKEDMHNSPSRKDGIDQFTELRYRQAAAQLIQECGKRLQLTQLTINTAIVFMHRFFMMHSLKRFDKCDIAGAAVFLAAKVEETPRKIQHVICVRDAVQRHGKNLPEQKLDTNSDEYKKRVDILVEHELIMLQTFGFDISIDHPHTHVIRATQFMRAPRELSQVAYFMATNSLNLTTFCLEFRSEIVAATCIYLAFKWSEFEVSLAQDGRPWWAHLDKNLTEEQLIENVRAYIQILEVIIMGVLRGVELAYTTCEGTSH
jgi:cyclin T